MNWVKGRKTRKVSRRASSKRRTKRASKSTRRNSSRRLKKTSVNKKPNRIVFVKNKPRVAHPKTAGSGYFYTRRSTDGKTYKVTVNGRTFSQKDAKRRLSNLRKKR
jgi:hypothetical protein